MTLTIHDASGPSGYVPLPAKVLEFRTGDNSAVTKLLIWECAWPAEQHGRSITGQSILRAFEWPDGVDRYVAFYETSSGIYEFTRPIDGLTLARTLAAAARSPYPVTASPTTTEKPEPIQESNATQAVTPAEELQRITQLSSVTLARLFGVSRTTFYKWLEGATPRDERFQHLVETLVHVKAAQQRLSPTVDLTSWLRTPISPNGKSPLDYLQERRFSLFRGLIVRARSANMELAPVASVIAGRPMTREERALARDRISPSPRLPNDEE